MSGQVVDLEDRIRVLRHSEGVSYENPTTEKAPLSRDRRRERLNLLARRTGRAENWRDECPIDDRAEAIGVSLNDPPKGQELASARASRKYVRGKEEAFPRTKPVLPPAPSLSIYRPIKLPIYKSINLLIYQSTNLSIYQSTNL